VILLPPRGPERTRQLRLLAVLTLVLAVWGWYRYWPTTASSPAPTSKVEGKGSGSSGKDKLSLPDAVKLPDLEPAPDASQPDRNPFRFGQKPLPPPVVQRPVDPGPPPPPPPPPAPLGPPPIQLKLLSFVVDLATRQRQAGLQDETGATFWVFEAGSIDGKYKVVKFNADSVVVSYLNGTGMKTVYLEK
jgi:hypothetical protein